ncbi:hypothetical protein Prudu_52S000300 [Prunus dulcis]|uniref:Uncharacterized protein n=1 Tax=Prunus dulcis TaxID=3755 RepID=A0A5H2XJK7_PRUDU|nr:hypothetical protein Prudu_52S000300 [Prunus dulcis]
MTMARKGKSQDRASGIAHPQSSRLSLDCHISNESSHDNEMQETCRGKAKGKDGNGTPIVIHRGRIITTRAVRTIGVLFYQAIDGAWPTFKTFPSTQMDLLYDRFNTTGYTHTCSEEEMREAFEQHVKLRYSDWMSALRNSVFKKYKTTSDRYTHCPLGISQDVLSKLDKIKRNKSNKVKSTIVHTTGSVPMEKYRKDEEKMENKKVVATEDENEEVIGGPSQGRILGLGGGYSTKDVYPSDDQACNKCICSEREEEHEKLKEEVKDLKSVLYELKDLVQSMRENNSNTYARSRQSASMDNVESCLDAHLEDE